MSNVTLSIGGRSYTVACAEGEEAHIAGLGRLIDSKLQSMGQSSGQNEVRALLFAALLLADEVHELRSSPSSGAHPAPAVTASVSPERIESIAERLENLAIALEG